MDEETRGVNAAVILLAALNLDKSDPRLSSPTPEKNRIYTQELS